VGFARFSAQMNMTDKGEAYGMRLPSRPGMEPPFISINKNQFDK
jgi:hypothetical protein